MMLSAALAAFLSLCMLFTGGAQAWVVTSYYQHSLEVQTYQRAYSTYTTTYTYQEAVKPTVTSFAPVSIETTVDSYDEITVVNVLVPTGVATVGNQDDYYDDYNNYNSRTTYYVDVTLTANTRSCLSNDWVWKTSYPVDVPSGVTPTAASIVTKETQYSAFGPTSTYTQAFLNPTDIPSSSLSSMSSYVSNNMYWEYSCTVPGSYRTGLISERGAAVTATGADLTGTAAAALATPTSSSDNIYAERCLARLERNGGDKTGGRYGYDNGFEMGRWEWCDENYDCECYRGLPWWAIIPIIWGSWTGLFLLIGLLESWFRFRSLCRGRSARRGMPIAWTLIFIPWTCFFLCCLKRGFQKKSPEEQKILEEEWKAMGFWRKVGRWLKWGFRYKYPGFLGPAPFRRTKWEEKDIAAEAQRRLSVAGAPMAQGGYVAPVAPLRAGTPGLPIGTPLPMGDPVTNHPNEYYAPQQPPRAYVAPAGVGATDFAEQGNRNGSLPVLPPVTQVSPVSPIEPASASIAGPAPRSPKGKEKAREDLRGNPAVGV